MSVILVIIFVSLIIHIGCFVFISQKEGSYVNVFFPYIFKVIQVSFVLEPLYLYYFGRFGSLYSYFYIYSCYALVMIGMVLAYAVTPSKLILALPFSKGMIKTLRLPYILFLCAFLIYLPVLIEFREFLFSPREIYLRTRTGYGLSFFLSTFLSLLAYVCYLLYNKWTKFGLFFFTVLNILFLYLHGSKGQMLTIFYILALYFVYIRNWVVNFKKLLMVAGVGSALIISLFVITTTYQYDSILKLIVSYSDFNRNAMIVIDSNDAYYNGQITLESNVYSRVPRAVMPDKPKDFGVFKLAKKYYPDWFYSDSGSPAFGFGAQFADWGNWAILYILVWGIITGFLLKLFVNRLKQYRMPGDMIIVLFLSEISLLPIGDGYLLPEHLFVGLIISILLSIKIRIGHESFGR